MTAKPLRTPVLLAALTVLFYWKILLTNQFTLLSGWEGVNQAYSWLQFARRSLRSGSLPLWDPYTFAGHSFVGEMQTSGLSPLTLLLAIVRPNSHDMLPVWAYNVLFGLLHFLGLAFAYGLARELRMRRVAAIVTGLCFSMGGFLGHIVDWPDLIQSAIWLPLMTLFLIRALRSHVLLTRLFNAALAGFTIGLAVLGGRLHMVMMQVIVAVTAAAFYAWQGRLEEESEPEESAGSRREAIWPRLMASGMLVAVLGAVTVAAGAFQFFASYSYAPKAIRYLGEQNSVGNAKIPYAYLTNHSALPESIVTFLVPFGFNGSTGQGEFITPYIGVLPFLLAIYAVITRWRNPWVRYFGFLALGATLYSFGQFSALHGVLYAVIPKLWMLRESGRMVYLSSFSLAVLAGFGADSLFRPKSENHGKDRETHSSTRFFERSILALVLAGAAVLVFGSAFNLPVNAWVQLSIVLIFLAYGVYRAAASGSVGRFAQCFAIFIIMFDLAAFDWTARNKIDVGSHNELTRLVGCQDAANYLKSLPGPFRVGLPMPTPPNIGDAFGVLTTSGAGATLLFDYARMQGRPDLLDVQYVMKPASTGDPDSVYHDNAWKIFRAPNAFQHAWVVHKAERVAPGARFDRVYDPKFDFRLAATTTDPLDGQLDQASDPSNEVARFTEYRPDRFRVDVTSKGRGLLVLSEIYDSDWTAKVNGKPVTIHPVDGGLRGVVVPDGKSIVSMRYVPLPVFLGGALTSLTFLGMLGFGFLMWRKRKSESELLATAFPDADRDALKTV